MSFGIRGEGLEAEGWGEEAGSVGDEEDDDDGEETEVDERRGLVRR